MPTTDVPESERQVWINNKLKPRVELKPSWSHFSLQTMGILEGTFNVNRTPSGELIETLAQMLGEETKKIHTWFVNREAMSKKVDAQQN